MGERWNRYLEWRRDRSKRANESGHWPFLSKNAERVWTWSCLFYLFLFLAVLIIVAISKL